MSAPRPGSVPLDEPLVVDVWNVGQALGKGARLAWQLRRLTRGADVIGLLEAARYTRLLRVALGRRWHVYRAHHPGADRSSDVVVLVHKRRVPRPRIHTIGHAVPWLGPKNGLPHRGRSWPVLDWPNLRLIIDHRTPGGPTGGASRIVDGFNRRAWVADLDALETSLDEVDVASAILGDKNARRGELDELADLGLRVIYTATAVDHGATSGIPDTDVVVLPKAGSDHHRIRWTLRLKRAAA